MAAKKTTGRAKGGVARAEALTSDQRKGIAKKAAAARWGEKPLKATHKGSFKEEFGIDVECYVLDDSTKTAVISQRGMGAALGLNAGSGVAFTRFVVGKAIAPYLGAEIQEKIGKPLKFQWGIGGAQQQPSIEVYGYDVTLLIDICKAIITAESEGKLHHSQANVSKQAHVIIAASAKAGIRGLVYALAGYDATRQEVVAAYKMYVREEAREYEKEFPEQLYQEWYRLYELARPERNHPWKFMHLTNDQVYKPLAKSSGRILSLTKDQRDKSNQPSKKLHQFLSEIGVKALRTQLGQLLGIARISRTKEEYERHFQTIFGDQLQLLPPDLE